MRYLIFLLNAVLLLMPQVTGMNAQTLEIHPAPVKGESARPPSEDEMARLPVVPLPVRSMKLIAPETGWVNTGSKILWTSDSGNTWKDISPITPSATDSENDTLFSSVFFLDRRTGWVVYHTDATDRDIAEYELHVALTTDGGASWTYTHIPQITPEVEMTGGGSLAFADRLHGWLDVGIMRTAGALFETSDGGHTWHRTTGDPGSGVSLTASSGKDLWMSGGPPDYRLYVSHDGAKTVKEVHMTPPSNVQADSWPTYKDPIFLNSIIGYEEVTYEGEDDTDGMAVLFSTSNGGNTWKSERILTHLEGITTGDRLNSAFADSTWMISSGKPNEPRTILKIPANTGITDGSGTHVKLHVCNLSFLTEHEGWRVCSGLESTQDGGKTWRDITPRF